MCRVLGLLMALALGAQGVRISRRSFSNSSSFDCPVGVGLSLNFQKTPISIQTAARKMKSLGVRCVRMWHYQADYLQAFLDVGIKDVLVNVPTYQLGELASQKGLAASIAKSLKPFYSRGMRFRVAVGNEPLASWEGGNGNAPLLLPGMENMHEALQANGLSTVTTQVAFYNGVMGVGYPPADGAFVKELVPTIKKVVDFIHRTGGDFNLHIYPFFAVMYDSTVPLDLALGKQSNTIDGVTYSGLLHQQVAATRAALKRLDPKYATMPISIGECGWPSKGHWAATTQNAQTFVNHVINNIDNMDPHMRSLYLFEAFDEQLKSSMGHGGPGMIIEDHFGVMFEDGTPKFRVDW